MVSAKPIVLITGVSGYIGCHVARVFVEDGGFEVRGTVRNLEKIPMIKAALGDRFE